MLRLLKLCDDWAHGSSNGRTFSSMFVADGINAPFRRTCIVAVSMVTFRIPVRELPIPEYQWISWLRCPRRSPSGNLMHSSYSTAGSSSRSLKKRDEVHVDDSHHTYAATDSVAGGVAFTDLGMQLCAAPKKYIFCHCSM